MKYLLLLLEIFLLISSIFCIAAETTCEELPRYNYYTICITKKSIVSVDNYNKYKSSELIIDDRRINKIFDHAFKNLPIQKLILRLANEKLHLTTQSFDGLPMLEYLEFRSGIVTLGLNLFGSINKLKYLGVIVDSETEKLDKKFLELENSLTTLSIAESKLRNLDGEIFFGIVSHLTDLDLSRNDIEFIKPMTFQVFFKELKSLTLDSNKLTDLKPKTFYGLDKLEVLSINYNKLTTIKSGYFNGSLRNLKQLYIESSGVMDIENDAFINLNITMLSLKSNKLKIIQPRSFNGLNQLDELFLNNNNFTIFPQNIFKNAKSLKKIDLNDNKISEIKPGTFNGSDLDCLNLTNNKLEFIGAEYFQGIKTGKLDISNNFIRGIVQDSFKNSKVRTLYIKNARLKYVFKTTWGLSETMIII